MAGNSRAGRLGSATAGSTRGRLSWAGCLRVPFGPYPPSSRPTCDGVGSWSDLSQRPSSGDRSRLRLRNTPRQGRLSKSTAGRRGNPRSGWGTTRPLGGTPFYFLGPPPCFCCKQCWDQGGTCRPSIGPLLGSPRSSGVPGVRPREIWVPEETGEGHASVP